MLVYYRISGTFHAETVWGDFSKIAKLKSLPMLFLRGHWLVIPGQSTKLNVHQSVIVAKSPNLMSAKCTTPTVCKLCTTYVVYRVMNS